MGPSVYQYSCVTLLCQVKPNFAPCVGLMLDSFARASLWQSGLDYLHGTGHGVGAFLNVHEGNNFAVGVTDLKWRRRTRNIHLMRTAFSQGTKNDTNLLVCSNNIEGTLELPFYGHLPCKNSLIVEESSETMLSFNGILCHQSLWP